MTNLEIVIHNSYKANQLFYVDKHEASLYLGKILELTYTQPDFLSRVPLESAGAVGQAYLNLLDLVEEQDFFQTLSTLGYYFISCGLNYNRHDCNLLGKRIIILNLGARSFCRTIAKAKELYLPDNVDFSDWKHLPKAVKYVLMLEYSSFRELQTMALIPHDMLMRKQWLYGAVKEGYFDDICSIDEVADFALTLHDDVMVYLNTEITKKGTFCFYE